MTNEANNTEEINEYENHNDKEDDKPNPNEAYDIFVDDSDSLNESYKEFDNLSFNELINLEQEDNV